MRLMPVKELLPVVAIALVVAVASLAATRFLPFVGAVERWAEDLRVATLSPPEGPHPDIVVISVTEDTLAQLPYRSPLDRQILAVLLRALAGKGVRAVGLDVLFDQPTEKAKDMLMKAVLKSLGIPVVVAVAGPGDGLTERQTVHLDGFVAGLTRGHAYLPKDGAGTVRRTHPGRPFNGTFVRGLAPALAAELGATVPEASIPIAFRMGGDGDTPAFRIFPIHTVPHLPPAWLDGKVVLIGSDLPGTDRHRTPLTAADGKSMAGVVIHAHILAQLLDGRRAPGTGPAGQFAVVLALAVLGILFALMDVNVPLKAAAGVGGLAALWVGGFALFMSGGVLLPLVAPSLSLVLSAGIGSAYLGRRDRRQKQFIRKAFSRYVASAVVDQLVEDPGKLSLGGERREISCFFTDLEGFTSMVEKNEPSEVLPLLNLYLDGMCSIARDHQGTIDKIVGDAMDVFFNAPLDQPNHRAQAMRCVLAMNEFANAFVAEQAENGFKFGKTRIGVNTGMAVVGNFGGEAFFDYTGHGDTVNTAARLESVNKFLGTTICVAGATAQGCPDVTFRPVGDLVLKGKTRGLPAFEPLTAEAAASPEIARYNQAYELMQAEDPAALPAFERLAEDCPRDTLAALHARRLRDGDTGITIVLKDK